MPKRKTSRAYINHQLDDYGNPGNFSCSTSNYSVKTAAENIYLTVENKIIDSNYYYNDDNININHPTSSCLNNIINEYSEKILEILKGSGGIGLILSEQQINALHNKFIKPYNEEGPYTLPPQNIFDSVDTYIVQLIENGNGSNTLLLMIKDILNILRDGRNKHIDHIRIINELSTTKDKYLQSLAIINKLRQQLESCDNSDLSTLVLSGSIGIQINQPKPFIYAQAILDLNIAWYIYIHKNSDIENNKFLATTEYVNSLGTHEEAHNCLISLLDEKFSTIIDDINNND